MVGRFLRGGDNMRSLVSRLARLERLNRLSTAPKRLRIQYGYLKTLPEDYTGPRHVVTVKEIPPEDLPPSSRAEAWFEWQERPGLEPASDATGPNDDFVIQVCYVEAKGLHGCYEQIGRGPSLKLRQLAGRTATDMNDNAVCRLVNGQAFWNGPWAALPQVSRLDSFRIRRHSGPIHFLMG
jgi:hypothetical protein